MQDEYVPIRIAAQFTGLHPNTLRKFADNNKVQSYKSPAGQRMFHKQSLQTFCRSTPTCIQVSKDTKQSFIYVRVSSKKQHDDLLRQLAFLQSRKPEYVYYKINLCKIEIKIKIVILYSNIIITMNIQINDNSKCEVFHVIFQNIRLFSENININFKIDAMSIQTMDSSHVSILELNIPNIWFDSYTINKDMVVGINTVLFLKVLSTREKGQSIQIILPIDETDKINIKFESEKSIFNKDFEVPMVDLDTDILAIPEMEYQAEFSLPSSHFYGLVNQLKLFGDCLDILCSEEKITLCSNSVDSGKMMVNIDIDDLTSFAIDEGETLNMSFSLSHLYNMVQFHKISTNMNIFLKSEFPIKICMKLSSDLDAYISMYLAPKISDE